MGSGTLDPFFLERRTVCPSRTRPSPNHVEKPMRRRPRDSEPGPVRTPASIPELGNEHQIPEIQLSATQPASHADGVIPSFG